MASEPVHPLRIAKGTNISSPKKMSGSTPRPLSEISPAEKRRNSPSWFKASSPKKASLNNDSSPFQPSPIESATSPRMFWENRHSANRLHGGRSGSPPSNRRSSIERLQKASRVKNSNILALEQKQEYDPNRTVHVEKPLAKVQVNTFGSLSSSGELGASTSEYRDFETFQSNSKASQPTMSPSKVSPSPSAAVPATPRKDQTSPAKSSLSPSKFRSSFELDHQTWSAESSFNDHELPSGRSLHRHVKSVTFDAAPPQINEYEMATPDLSSVGTNSREGSYESADDDEDDVFYEHRSLNGPDDSFDASLEDTAKTPVVGPDEWRSDSPMICSNDHHEQFEGSPMPDSVPSTPAAVRQTQQRTDSVNSNGDHRPLPPIPGRSNQRPHSSGSAPSSPGLSATAERMLGSHRSLPVPPPASATKSDIQSFGHSRMNLEERLKLMMLSDDNNGKTAAEQQRERRMRRGANRERTATPVSDKGDTSIIDTQEVGDDTLGDISALDEFQMPPRISRESIMRKVNSNKALEAESEHNFSSPAGSPLRPQRGLDLDPDVPIPSTEDSIMEDADGEEASVIITRIPEEDENDVSGLYNDLDFSQGPEDINLQGNGDDDSQYSQNTAQEMPTVKDHQAAIASRPISSAETIIQDTATDIDAVDTSGANPLEAQKSNESNIDHGFDPKNDTSLRESQKPATPDRSMSKPEYDGSGWGEPEDECYDDPGTPDSVIRHPVSDSEEAKDIPAIPESMATIKASSGSKLKTRVSATPSDLAAMREARRHVSQEIPSVPPIPEKHRNRVSRDMSVEQFADHDDFLERHPSFKDRSLTLDLDTGLSLDQDFERVIEAQKRGYLMRQNTKLVAASDKDATDESPRVRSAASSPLKKERPDTWTVEPWNGQVRPRSNKQRPSTSGPVPPLPGQLSNATTLNQVQEEDLHSEAATHESGERGRLFVKVMGVKDLDLPIPRHERSWFCLTLDNGVHCVTTAWLELARNAPIGQEFELVVPNDLEFQLTLNVKLEKPPPSKYLANGKVSKPKTSTFSKVFASPKKRKEIEHRQRMEEERYAQQQRETLARQRNASPTAYELLSPLAAEDGSFARSYVCLKEHEHRCYGRPYIAEVACFNEWATEEESFASSVKSKRGEATIVRRAPYKVGKLELQLLFVPRPKNATDDDMPKSMNSCIRELKATEERLSRSWEGHLSQQGGDCPYWRRRYFKLVGAKLTAYHEATRQPRATINLANAKRLIDDRRALTEKETFGKGGKRRRSAFAEEEEGYMFVEEGFRIRFNNGEVIDFYADTAVDKEAWMKVLSEVLGRGENSADEDGNGPRSRAKWCELVLKKEEQQRKRIEGRRSHSRSKSTFL